MALRGHIIEGATLLKRLEDVGGMPQFNDLKHGLKIFKYFLWTLNNHLTLTTDTTFKGAGYWFYDKLYFQGKVEKFENSTFQCQFITNSLYRASGRRSESTLSDPNQLFRVRNLLIMNSSDTYIKNLLLWK